MVKYEIKKVLSGIGGRFALVILVIMVIVVSAIAICSVKFVNEEGISSTGIVLAVLGSGGGDCPIQAGFHGWKSFYNITCFQEYLLTIFGGYIGTLFILTAAMLVSAVTKSAIIAVTLPVAVLFLPTFIGELGSVSGVLGLLPDQLLQAGYVVSYFNSYEIGGRVVGALPILFVTYTVLFLVLVPVLYELYRES